MSKTSEATEHVIGAHSVRLEPPDTYIIRHVNDITSKEVEQILDLVNTFIGGRSGIFGIIDYSQAGNMPPDARRSLLARMSHAHAGIVFANVSTLARVGISLGRKAYLMMTRGQDTPFAFVDSLEEAHSWVAAHRKPAKH